MKPWIFFLVLLSALLSGCASHQGKSVSQQRQAIENMRAETLNTLYRQKPYAADTIERSAGYAVFSNANVNLLFASAGGGYGVVHSNNGTVTYMKMGELGIGLGLGAKDYRLVFVFHTKDALRRFVEHGWAFGGQLDAAAKAKDKGDAIGGEITVDNITIYQLTESGLALQATIKGTKFWRDDSLN
ncbi:YSC84-related protein [Rheinheimera sp. 4Y26]|uniref:lipid-binding SYLF domain-containing protein n=1 Tax=Rheinheimera sp. 4Y26 TaxID=2977811 RepID=UPI0021B102B9|nr:YSC84-related protein [Rheinheimera sp. 4Y26]MCT6700750.1 YSC84-related protein [Rheinheimera sp. 4Y26]